MNNQQFSCPVFFDHSEGLRGLSLADLEKLNRKPFKLRGFDKDNTATVSDWTVVRSPRSPEAARPVLF
jgi:hypothetical protein